MKRFFFRKINSPSKYNNIDFILNDVDSPNEKYLDVKKASEMVPDWYKTIPAKDMIGPQNHKHEMLTIKRCIPVLDALSSGYFLVTTEDYDFEYMADKDESVFSGRKNIQSGAITHHPIEQLGDMPFSPEFIKYAYKWASQWTIRTPKGYSILFTHPLNYPNLPFYTLSGFVDTDKYPQPVLFPFLMKNNFSGTIPAGTPVVQIIPIKRKSWKSKVYNNVSERFKSKIHNHAHQYEKDRFDKDKTLVGGVYKRKYREKKEYF